MMKLVNALLCLSPIVVISFAGCKQQVKRADIKTLDSIANPNAPATLYQCRGGFPLNAMLKDKDATTPSDKIVFDEKDPVALSEASKKDMRLAVQNYFTALEPNTQSLFLDGFGGSVLITSRVNDFCVGSRSLQKLNSQAAERAEGCFVFATDPKGVKKAILTLVHRPNAKNIQYYGPQLFGYMYAQFYPRIGQSDDPKKLFSIHKDENTVMLNHKENVANNFLRDLLDNKVDLKPLELLLGKSSVDQLATASKNKSSLIDSLTFDEKQDSRKKARKIQVIDYFFAHAYQSMHCDEESLTVAREKFKNSHDNFAAVDEAIRTLSGTLMGRTVDLPAQSKSEAVASSKSSSKDSLSLGGSPLDMLSSLMPALGGGATAGAPGMLAGLLSGGGGGIASLFSQFSGLMGGGGAGIDSLVSAGSDSSGDDLYDNLDNSGCPSGNCPNGSCSGNCSGGVCTNCTNGNCGGCTGSVNT